MNDLEKALATLQSSIKECDSHIEKIERAHKLLSPIFPLDADKMRSLDEVNVEHVDQLIYRFTKLQDAMGTRMFPSLYTCLEASSRPTPFLDMLMRLEQLGVVNSAEDWQYFRNLRNNLAHDYPESLEQTSLTLDKLYQSVQRLKSLYQQARSHAQLTAEKLSRK